jgi:hypothetical protein
MSYTEKEKEETIKKFRETAFSPDMQKECHMIGKEVECVGPDPSYFIEHGQVDPKDIWDDAPIVKWHRKSTLKDKGCFFQSESDEGMICAKYVLVLNRIDEHILLGSHGMYPCPLCNESFDIEKKLRAHLRWAHEGEQLPRPCDCGEEYLKQGRIWWCPGCKENFVVVVDGL